MRITRIKCLLLCSAAAALETVLGADIAAAHIAFDDQNRFRHISHSRHLNFYNGVGNAQWHAETRDAQIDWNQTMNGHLAYNSSGHDAARIAAGDANHGATGWVGFADQWHYHGEHGHVLLNLHYFQNNNNYLQMVACHEIGHHSGLAHSSNAGDCMHTPVSAQYPTIGGVHRSDLIQKWNDTGH